MGRESHRLEILYIAIKGGDERRSRITGCPFDAGASHQGKGGGSLVHSCDCSENRPSQELNSVTDSCLRSSSTCLLALVAILWVSTEPAAEEAVPQNRRSLAVMSDGSSESSSPLRAAGQIVCPRGNGVSVVPLLSMPKR